MIRAWIYAGPFSKDVSDLYLTNYDIPVAPYLPMLEEAESALAGLQPSEGEMFNFWGEETAWKFQRTDAAESKVTWIRWAAGHAHLVVTYAYTRLTAAASKRHRFQLSLAGCVHVTVNGRPVFSARHFGSEKEYAFEADLLQGANDILILVGEVQVNYGVNSFRLTADDPGLVTDLPLLLGREERAVLESDFRGFYLADSMWKPGGKITVCWDHPVRSRGTFLFSVSRLVHREEAGRVAEASRVLSGGEESSFELLAADDLPHSGSYLVRIDYQSGQSEFVSGIRLEATCLRYLPGLSGPRNCAERRTHYLRHVARIPVEEMPLSYVSVFRELARLESGQEPDPAAIRNSITYIDQRRDCSDFAMHALLRLYIKHRENPALPAELKEEMKRCILDFKYASDEGGRSMMYMLSENHRILFHSAEYLAGLLFPTETFTNSHQNGLFHSLKGKLASEQWIREKGAFGFEEWHSNCYFEEDLLALLSLHDFGEKKMNLQVLAGKLIDFLCAILASHTSHGVMATTHGRSYQDSVMHPEMESMSRMNWLLFGLPKEVTDKLSIGAVALAASDYAPSPAWEQVAAGQEDLLTRTRMGLFLYAENGGVNCSTYRTRHYMVSGVVESLMGRPQFQAQAGEVFLNGKVPVFVTSFQSKSSLATPSYWGGQFRMPKTITHRNVIACIYRLEAQAGATHCYFPESQFDAVVGKNGWLFGKSGDSYVGVYSSNAYERVRTGQYRGRELLCAAKENIWIIEAGSADESGSFEQFIEAVSGAAIEPQGCDLVYDSPSVGKLELGWSRVCTVGGRPVLEDDFPLIENAHAFGEYGGGLVNLNLDGSKQTLRFFA